MAMTANRLIKVLETMPGDAEVEMVYDGAARADVNCVWVAASGHVLLADIDERCLYRHDRPIEVQDDLDWRTTPIDGQKPASPVFDDAESMEKFLSQITEKK